jgi:hypothetical protein
MTIKGLTRDIKNQGGFQLILLRWFWKQLADQACCHGFTGTGFSGYQQMVAARCAERGRPPKLRLARG